MIRVLIVDDHTVVRRGLRSMLSSKKLGMEVVGEASDGDQAVQLAEALRPDVILMDMQMPVKSGLEAIQEIRHKNMPVRILVLSSFGEDERVAAAMRAGASGYVLKDSSPDELLSAVKAVASGQVTIAQALSAFLIGGSAEIGPSNRDDEPGKLTTREVDVLRCLANGASNKEIAVELGMGLTTVRTHVSSILRKLNLESRTQAALLAREKGLVE